MTELTTDRWALSGPFAGVTERASERTAAPITCWITPVKREQRGSRLFFGRAAADSTR
jgi:hypothetical protein